MQTLSQSSPSLDVVCSPASAGVQMLFALSHCLSPVLPHNIFLSKAEFECRRLGQKVFSRAATDAKSQKVDETWRESLYRVYRSGQQNMRVAVYGAKHDAAMFEQLLQDICVFDDTGLSGNAMVDTAVSGSPKVRGCSSLTAQNAC